MEGFKIEPYLGEVVEIEIEGNPTQVQLVDGEIEFNQPGISCGFVHFADPNDRKKCLGYGGVNVVYDLVKVNNE